MLYLLSEMEESEPEEDESEFEVDLTYRYHNSSPENWIVSPPSHRGETKNWAYEGYHEEQVPQRSVAYIINRQSPIRCYLASVV